MSARAKPLVALCLCGGSIAVRYGCGLGWSCARRIVENNEQLKKAKIIPACGCILEPHDDKMMVEGRDSIGKLSPAHPWGGGTARREPGPLGTPRLRLGGRLVFPEVCLANSGHGMPVRLQMGRPW